MTLGDVSLCGVKQKKSTVVKGIGLLAAAGLALGLAGCAGQSDSASTPSYQSTYKAPDPTTLSPLTGVTVPQGSVTGPALSVKVCNIYACAPQEGLNQADVVFEEVTEGGITRYVAIYQSNIPETSGPVRSLRPMDADIAGSFGGVIAFSGYGNPAVYDLAVAAGLQTAMENNPAMFRNDYNVAPYNLMVNMTDLAGQFSSLPVPAQQWAYSSGVSTSTAAVDGAPASGITTVMSNSSSASWTYDPASEKYLRNQWGGADVDITGAQFAATNVIAMRVNVENFVNLPRTIMVASGEAWIFTGGKHVHGTWSKESTNAPIKFVGDNGVTVRLAPGNTWIALVPVQSYVSEGSVTITP